MFEDGKEYLIVIEWGADEEPDPDDLYQEAGDAYEFGGAVAPEELAGSILGAKEEARDLLDSLGAGHWVDVLIGVGETVDDVDVETALKVYTFEA